MRRRSFLAGGASALALSGCAGTGDPEGTLSVMDYYTSGPSSTGIEKILQSCGKKAGVEIQRQSMPREQLLSKTLQLAAARDLPGLLMLDNPDLQQIADTGALMPLSELGITTEGYYDSIESAGRHDGEVYALGLGVNALALIYNKDKLDAVGIEPPKTWDQLRTASRKLSRGSTYGVGFASPANEEGSWQFEPFLWSNGGDLHHLDAPEAVEALQLWVDLVRSGRTSRSVVNWTQDDLTDQFIGGHVAMMINGSWTLAQLDQAEGLNYGVAPIPVPNAGDKVQVPLGGEVWTIPRTNPTTQRTAARILRCMASEQNMLAWAEANAVVPTQVETAAKYARTHPTMRPFVEEIETAQARTAELGTRYPVVSQALWTAIQEALVGAKPPKQALRAAQRKVEASRGGER